ncbi:ATP-binding cassette domain-containing protein [Frankia gtarii]|uniref:ATP-binding cassette domain-containing protein n=1 Tax=Frankia gtarii TaxID=2950102 RepID=UPI0021BEAC13|nr:ATP-binding cassette domain-containing protein [Frankia gtarii]
MSTPVIEAEGLTKRYGETQALAGVSLAVGQGTVLGVLGPNGAGKSTTVRVLTTLTRPDSGSARVAGWDVRADPGEVRRRIGVTAQDATVDQALTARQNLRALGPLVTGTVEVSQDGRRLRAAVDGGAGLATAVVRALDQAGVLVDDVAVHPPSLDDVFHALTGTPVDSDRTVVSA